MMRLGYRKFLLFMAFVVAAAVMWFLFRYNNTYVQEVPVTIQWTNIPADLQITSDNREMELPVMVSASGFRLLWTTYDNLQIPLDFREYIQSENEKLIFKPETARESIDLKLGSKMKVNSVPNRTYTIDFQRYKSKMVPLDKQFKVSYTGSFQEVDAAGFSQDSVMITGNDDAVDQTNLLKINIDNITVSDTLVEKQIDLASMFPTYRIEPSTVTYTIRAAEMTEGSYRIPVQLMNKPAGAVVKIIPEIVEVVFTSQLNNYDNIQSTDFTATVDFSKLEEGESIAIPQVNYENPSVNKARLQPQSVQILVIE
jgi:hypothetical protein